MEGFTGKACQRLSCTNDCNGHGSCKSMEFLAEDTYDENSAQYTYETVWDATKIYGCECDPPYTGNDCSIVECPRGDDPLTGSQVNEVQYFRCSATGGNFVFLYKGLPTGTIEADMIDLEVKKQIEKHPLIREVDVKFELPQSYVCRTGRINAVRVEFLQDFGSLPPLVPIIDGLDLGGAVDVSADGETAITDSSGTSYISQKGTKENEYCSDRGLCDVTTGVCQCFDTNADEYSSSDGYGRAGTRGDCGYALTATATCPGEPQCSGHGICGGDPTYKCSCSSGWMGGDCAQRSCPDGPEWYGYPSSDEVAHDSLVECSAAGTCDRSTGTCSCATIYFGKACEYMACGGGTGNACSGHGRCMSMTELALHANDNGDATDFTYGTDPNKATTWDGTRIFGCKCDDGWQGYDCAMRTCSLGDDPGTYGQFNELQLLECQASSGTFSLRFRQESTQPIPFNATVEMIEKSLESIPTINDIEVKFSDPEARACYSPEDGESCNLVFLQFVTEHNDLPDIIPDVSLLTDVTGDLGSGDVSIYSDGAATGPGGNGCPIHSSIRGDTESEPCSNRGICDTATGRCACFDGWSSSNGKGGKGSITDCGYRVPKKTSGGGD